VRTFAEVVEEVSQTAAAGDKVGHLAAYRKLAALLAADPAHQDVLGLFVQADMQRDIARAAFDIGSDEACPALDQGNAYLSKARAVLARAEEAGAPEALDGLEREFARERRGMGCPPSGSPADVGTPDASLAGHYYLSGVMETGSELLLKPDGQFEWYISYGAVDQVAEGRWGRTGQTVTLVTDVPPTEAPLFRGDEVFPWDADVERLLRRYERAELEDKVAARCPWNIAATTTLWAYDLENPKPVTDAELAKASEAKRAAETARDEASRIFATAASATASDDDRAAASAAMEAWGKAQSEMAQAHHDANLPEPDIGSPAVPPECQLPPEESYKPIPESEWHRGVGVVVGDPAREMRLSDVEVTFVFEDGHRETAKTRRGGMAFVPVRKGAAVQQITLALSEPVSRSETLSITPLAEGLQAVIVDTRQVVEPAFSVMRLEVQGDDLVPKDMPRGRYSRH
jgi:hypothetical protein